MPTAPGHSCPVAHTMPEGEVTAQLNGSSAAKPVPIKPPLRLRFGLRDKLVGFALVALLPALILAAVDSFVLLEQHRSTVQHQALLTARLAAQQAEEVALATQRFLDALSEVDTVKRGPPEQRDALFAALARRYPRYNAIFFLEPDGREQGISTYQPGEDRLLAGERPYFLEALQSQSFTISRRPVAAKSTGRLVVPMVSPVRDGSGKLLGFVGAGVVLAKLQDLWSDLDLPPGTVVSLVNREDGRVIISTQEIQRAMGEPAATEQARQLQTEGGGSYQNQDADGGEWLVGFAQVQGAPWSVLVEVPTQVAFADWRAALLRTVALLALGVALALGLALVLAARLAAPARALAQAAMALAAGQFGHRVEVRSGDELERVAVQFNRMATQLERERALLEERVAEATADLRRMERLREEFLSVAAHELRTPLTGIHALAQLLLRALHAGRDVPPERLQRNLATILSQSRRLNGLVEDLLDVSRLRQDRLELRPAPADLVAVVRDALVLAEAMPEAEHHRLVLDTSETQLEGVWDAARMEQMVLNLVSNALKFSEAGSMVRVTVRGQDNGVLVAVADQGAGIPAGEVERLFQPFQRALDPATRYQAGLGLGLYIAKGIVEGHGGRIWVDSAHGQGTTFSVWVPRRRAEPNGEM